MDQTYHVVGHVRARAPLGVSAPPPRLRTTAVDGSTKSMHLYSQT